MKNIISSIANDYVVHTLNAYYEINNSNFETYAISEQSRFAYLSHLVGSDDLKQTLKEYNILKEDSKPILPTPENLDYAHESIYELSKEYTKFALDKENRNLESLSKADKQNYSAAIGNLEQLFNKHAKSEESKKS